MEKYDRVMKLMERQGGEVTPRDVYRAHITPRDDTPAAVALLDEMVQAGRLVLEERPSGRQNHVQRVYCLPPVAEKMI